MNRLGGFAVILSLFAGLAAEAAIPAPGPCVGSIKPRHAREIKASNWSIGAETMDRDFTIYRHWKQYLGPLGAKKARIQAGWAKTEKEKGTYDWAWLDEIIPDMVARGVEPWVCLCYGNPVYPGGGDTGLGGGLPTSEEALKAWDRFVAAFVDRYKQHVDEWEIWNEPGLRGKNKSEPYAKLLVRTARVVKGRQPDAKILAFAMAGIKIDFVKGVLGHVKRQDALDLIDEVTYHPYSYNPDQSYGAVAQLRKTVAVFSDRIRIRQGENGAPSKAAGFGALGKYDWNETRQAKWALRRLLGDLGRDIPSSYFSICDMQYTTRTNYKGLLAVNADRTVVGPKPAYFAVQRLTAVFDDTVKRIPDFRAEVSGGAEGSRHAVFGYAAAGGGRIVTLWRTNDAPGKRPDWEDVKLALPGSTFKEPVWVDLLTGRVHVFDAASWKREGDGTVFARVPVYDTAVLVAERTALPIGPTQGD